MLRKILLGYLVLINFATFIVRGVDKYKASHEKRRVSEKTLLRIVGLGGRVGAVFGMQAFRHKTVKGKFLTRFRLITIVWIAITVLLLFFY